MTGQPTLPATPSQVRLAAIALIALGSLQFALGALLLHDPPAELGKLTSATHIVAWMLLGEGVLEGLLGLLVYRGVRGALLVAAGLSLLALVAAALAQNIIAIVLRAAILALVFRGALTLRRRHGEERDDPAAARLGAAFTTLLKQVLNADGPLRRDEKQRLLAACVTESFGLQRCRELLDADLRTFDLRAAAERFRQAAREAGLARAEELLLVCAAALASAQGDMPSAEEGLVRELGDALTLPSAVVAARLRLGRARVGSLDSSLAREILDLPTGAGASLEEVCEDILEVIDVERWGVYLGDALRDTLDERRRVVERCRELLRT